MVSDSWEMAPILQGDAVICQEQHGSKMGFREVLSHISACFSNSVWQVTNMAVKFPLEAIETWLHFKQCLSEL